MTRNKLILSILGLLAFSIISPTWAADSNDVKPALTIEDPDKASDSSNSSDNQSTDQDQKDQKGAE